MKPLSFLARGRRVRSGAVMVSAESLEPRQLLSGYALQEIAALPANSTAFVTSSILLDSSGNLFAACEQSDAGVIEIPRGSSSILSLASFNFATSSPTNVVMDSSGNLYGTTEYGGGSEYPTEQNGLIFEIPAGSSSIEQLAVFNNTTGAIPVGNILLDSDGNLYGTTTAGGPYNDGTVFEFVRGTSSISTIAAFNSTDGASPWELVMDSNGDFFGFTEAPSLGTLFEIPRGSSSITTLFAFNQETGSPDHPSLALDSSGDLFGTYVGGNGANPDGTIFEFAAGSTAITTFAVFDDPPVQGSDPTALYFGSAGNLYGTTTLGGTSNDGTIFEIAAAKNAKGTFLFNSRAEFGIIIRNVPFDSLGMSPLILSY